jgi:hypothetical protein
MDLNIDWARTLRTLAVAALLLMALIGAVLGSIGLTSPVWSSACDRSTREAAPPPAQTEATVPVMPAPRPA